MSINESQFRALLDRYLKGKTTDRESKILEEFFNSYQKEETDFNLPDLSEEDKNEIFARINQQIADNRNQKVNINWSPWLKLAAAISFVCIAYFIYSAKLRSNLKDENFVATKTIVERTKKGEKASFQLPDGSVVHLNANSELTYPAVFNDTRTVKLSGEAFFEVKHDKLHPFEVDAAPATIQVLGTSFNVKSQADVPIQVTLVEGKVNIKSLAEAQELDPGYQAIIEDGIITKNKVDVQRYIAWKDNVLFFEGTKLEDAVVMLENWYNTDINISPSLKKCVITGQYKNESLENVLKSFEFLLNAKINHTDFSNITIEGSGCTAKPKP